MSLSTRVCPHTGVARDRTSHSSGDFEYSVTVSFLRDRILFTWLFFVLHLFDLVQCALAILFRYGHANKASSLASLKPLYWHASS